MISDISINSQIRLPGSEQETISEPEEKVFVTVSINALGQYSVGDLGSQSGGYSDIYGKADLERVLLEIRALNQADGKDILVLIVPDPASQIQATVDALDTCNKLGIPNNINTQDQELVL